MSKLPAPVCYQWVRPSVVPQELVLMGVSSWWSHWSPALSRAERCTIGDCRSCAEGLGRSIRYVFLVRNRRSPVLSWLELRARHYGRLEAIEQELGQLEGAVIRLWRLGPAANQPVELELIGKEAVDPHDIEAFVGSLGVIRRRSEAASSQPSAARRDMLEGVRQH